MVPACPKLLAILTHGCPVAQHQVQRARGTRAPRETRFLAARVRHGADRISAFTTAPSVVGKNIGRRVQGDQAALVVGPFKLGSLWASCKSKNVHINVQRNRAWPRPIAQHRFFPRVFRPARGDRFSPAPRSISMNRRYVSPRRAPRFRNNLRTKSRALRISNGSLTAGCDLFIPPTNSFWRSSLLGRESFARVSFIGASPSPPLPPPLAPTYLPTIWNWISRWLNRELEFWREVKFDWTRTIRFFFFSSSFSPRLRGSVKSPFVPNGGKLLVFDWETVITPKSLGISGKSTGQEGRDKSPWGTC